MGRLLPTAFHVMSTLQAWHNQALPVYLFLSSPNMFWLPFFFWSSPGCLPSQALGPAVVSPAWDTPYSALEGMGFQVLPMRFPLSILWKAAHLPITVGTFSTALATHRCDLCQWRRLGFTGG